MRFYKIMCLIVVVDIALFSLISLFYKPHSSTSIFIIMKYSFFVPLIAVSIMQLTGLLMNVAKGHVNTIGTYRFVVYKYDRSPLLFFFGVAWELILWILPMYVIYKFLVESN